MGSDPQELLSFIAFQFITDTEEISPSGAETRIFQDHYANTVKSRYLTRR